MKVSLLTLVLWLCVFPGHFNAQWGGQGGGEEKADPNSKVVILSDANFRDQVLKPAEPFFVQFYAPWCGHCRRMMPLWEDMAKTLEGQTHVGKVDCTVNEWIKNKYHIRGFPTIKLFANGRIDSFDGARTEVALKEFLDLHQGHISDRVEQEKYTLRSFDWRGDAEPIRIALAELGIQYEDIRYESEAEWEKDKSKLQLTGVVPFGQLPSLSIENFHLSMSSVILRHLARTHKMYGNTQEETSLIDSFISDCENFLDAYSSVVHESNPEKYVIRLKAFTTVEVPMWMSYFESMLVRSQSLWASDGYSMFFVGGKLSAADMCVFHALSTALGVAGQKSLQAYRGLREWFVGIGNRDNLSEYLSGSSRPQHMHGPNAKFGNAEHPADATNNPFRNVAA